MGKRAQIDYLGFRQKIDPNNHLEYKNSVSLTKNKYLKPSFLSETKNLQTLLYFCLENFPKLIIVYARLLGSLEYVGTWILLGVKKKFLP